MDYLLLALGVALIIFGILGCILPIIPGPPLSFLGVLSLHFTKFAEGAYTNNFLFIMALVAIAVTVLDYIIPIWGTKKFGGTKAGVWGATIGLIVGLFFSPFSAFLSIIFGPFIGAVVGESIAGSNSKHALKSGFGAFIGFLGGVLVKLVASGWMAWHFFKPIGAYYF